MRLTCMISEFQDSEEERGDLMHPLPCETLFTVLDSIIFSATNFVAIYTYTVH